MVERVLREVDPGVPVTSVARRAANTCAPSRSRCSTRKGRVRHVGACPELEDELCDFGPGGLSSGRSPDRLDALVWALYALMLQERAEPRVRAL